MAKTKIGAVAVIEFPTGSDSFVLVEETKEHKRGRLNLPGGGLNYIKGERRWESPLECARREAEEETRLKVKPIGYLDSFFYGDAGQLHLGVACIAIGGELKASDKHPTVETYPFDVIEDILVPEGHLRSEDRVIELIRQFREQRGNLLPLSHVRTSDVDILPEFHPPDLSASLPEPESAQLITV